MKFVDNKSGPYAQNIEQEGGAIFARSIARVTIDNSYFKGNYSVYEGAAVYGRAVQDFDVMDSEFIGNSTPNGTGGAIYSRENLNVNNSSFTGNSGWGGGGAIYTRQSSYIQQSTFTDNATGTGSGGAVSAGGAAHLANSAFVNNYSASTALGGGGGGVRAYSAVVENCLFFGNDLRPFGSVGGAGLLIVGDPAVASEVSSSTFISNGDDTTPNFGGAVYKIQGDLVISNSLLSDNSAGLGGGAVTIGNYSHDDTITYTTIVNNDGGGSGGGILLAGANPRLTVQNSILFSNTGAAPSGEDINTNGAYVLVRNSTYTDADSLFGVTVLGNVAGDPLLPAYGDNGGPLIGVDDTFLPTVIPGSGSPAIGLANSSLLPLITFDQIGVNRTTTPTNTAGAMWAPANPNPAPPTPTPTNPPSAPLNVTAQAGNASATISWTAPTSAGSFPVTDYQAVLSPGGQTCLVQAPLTTCSVTGLVNGTPYTASVRALNGAGWGAYSAASNSFTPSDPTSQTIVITGSRTEVRGKPGVQVDGTTTGLVGATVQARVRLAGQTAYSDAATRVVDPDGTFTWQRRTGKKVYVYFVTDSGEVRSNRVIINAR